MKQSEKKLYDWDRNPVIEDLDEASLEYILTEQMVDQYRDAMDDPHALFPTIAGKHDTRIQGDVYRHEAPMVNTRTMVECFNPPIPGKRLTVAGRIAGRYMWRGRWYVVTEAMCKDEDGRPIDRQTSIHMSRAEEVGKKWQ
jgi:hypothetical protein